MMLVLTFACPLLIGFAFGVALARALRTVQSRARRILTFVTVSLASVILIPIPLTRAFGYLAYDRPRDMGVNEFTVLLGLSVLAVLVFSSTMTATAVMLLRRQSP